MWTLAIIATSIIFKDIEYTAFSPSLQLHSGHLVSCFLFERKKNSWSHITCFVLDREIGQVRSKSPFYYTFTNQCHSCDGVIIYSFDPAWFLTHILFFTWTIVIFLCLFTKVDVLCLEISTQYIHLGGMEMFIFCIIS